MIHRVELDSVKKWRNQHEWRPVNRARCGDFEVVSDGHLLPALARTMLEAGMAGKMAVYRGETLCFAPTDLEVWASGKALNTQEQPEHLRKGQGDE